MSGDDEPVDSLGRAKKYLLLGAILFSALALPESRFQDLYRIVVWSIMVLGVMTAWLFPFLHDRISFAVLALMYLFHFGVVYLFYDMVPRSDYLVIGILGMIEIVCLLIPAAWLEVRCGKLNNPTNNG